MTYFIDTHVLLWYVFGDNRLKSKYINIVDNKKNDILISSASIWEIALKLSIGKLKLNTEFRKFVQLLENNSFQIVNYNTEDLITMIDLPFHHQDPFDRLIIAQSINRNIPIMSNDRKFKQYDISLI